MTWSRAILYLTIWGMLSVYYVVFERPAAITPAAVRNDERLVSLPSESINELRLDAPGLNMHCARNGGQWLVTDPPDTGIPSDLIAALIASLIEIVPVDVVGSGDTRAAAEFGLADPSVHLLVIAGTDRVGLQLGNRNPSQTAVYARRDGAAEIVLVGLNVQYYVDLIMDALRRNPA